MISISTFESVVFLNKYEIHTTRIIYTELFIKFSFIIIPGIIKLAIGNSNSVETAIHFLYEQRPEINIRRQCKRDTRSG